ncbi:hypothetical protein BCT30_04155 [Enterovibrio norvegicus]|uniref:Uncharacterized conserved protein, DUF924 family n=2 Tax=Enterovibrio norvegicus TaxID=188144 RepID=A0A1I5RMT0_9GAMM|nr:DUF924 family protein [Enterovibrio norvegicus]MCC4797964.1 DUF924 domain-containing protein [Enterovibrio norvegicus]OEE51542.1 hypothetical protein A1OS_05680 [Enterovibrio norvegicus]OEF58716.1 hypothetical protein A1OU_11195 [Enterovibrio norvegicus]OEF60348.1 hypothetical protein A1OW_00275 [Enterovibrio norvegicus]PMH72572.1 hypothetical protein BCU62_02850 [Enterovibrio norvegicus]
MDYIEVLDFWFGDADAPQSDDERQSLWFRGKGETDSIIRERFLPYVSMAGEGRFAQWLDSPEGSLANIILLDQFSRNIYRGLSAAFRYDEFALALCKRGLASAQDEQLPLIQRAFFYMPLQHSEHLEDQEEALFRYSQLCESAGPGLEGMFDHFYRHARIHHDIVKRFGRFPHRNASLGRLSTEDEIQWLADGGARFGQ